jgi:transcription-repair coupling factor (superfamily II helicase)
VNNVAERLSLYQDMDNIKGQEELDQYVKELEDRFGPIPERVSELMRSFKLRWLAQDLGIEKLVLKSGKMIGYFILNPKSEYYQSPIFTKVLDYMQKNPTVAKLSEKNDRLRIIYDNVETLSDAYNHIDKILKLN